MLILPYGCGTTIQNSTRINNADEAAKAASISNNFIKRWKPEPGMNLDQFYNHWVYSAPYLFINQNNKGYHFQIFLMNETKDWEPISIKDDALIEYKSSGYWILSLKRINSKIYYFNVNTKILEFVDKGRFMQTLISRENK